jgi:long-chain acyl-CoA synthetase
MNVDTRSPISAGIFSGDRHLDRAEFENAVARAARGFHEAGVRNGDCVALFLRNDFPFLIASHAAMRLGAYAVPVNWHFKAEELAYILADCGARLLIVHADLWPQISAGVPRDILVLVVATPPELAVAYGVPASLQTIPAGLRDFGDWLAEHLPWDRPPEPPTSSMIYTSGTTGRPKAVRRIPAQGADAQATQRLRDQVYGIREGMIAALPGPLYHSAPNSFGLRAAGLEGALILMPRFDAEGLLALIAERRITHMFMVPTMFVRLLKLPAEVRARYDVSSLEFVVHAAAPCPSDIKRAMIEWWGPIIHEYYGGTESGPVTFASTRDFLAKPGSVGRAVAGCTLRIVDDAGDDAPTGTPGEIFMRIAYYPDFTYHNQPDKRAEIERDGLITCGDVGYLDEDGYLFICDRKRDMVISGGVNIYPAEIEAVILAMPGVGDCAVFGIPDPEFGESLMAIVEPQPGATLDPGTIRAHAAAHLAGYKVPRRIEIGRDLPREDSGKIFKRRLRDPFWETAGRAI